jgi:hypothetical protein
MLSETLEPEENSRIWGVRIALTLKVIGLQPEGFRITYGFVRRETS